MEVLVKSVTPRDGKKPWKMRDGNDVEYVTWDDSVGAVMATLQGKQAMIESTLKQRGEYTDHLLDKIEPLPEAPPSHRQDEPSINTAKQVVIIRQNAWSQTNAIYATAVRLYELIYKADTPIDVEAVHMIAWQLISSNKRPEHAVMWHIAREVETRIRADWFPMTDDEIPF
jgi:hypothetical protein